MTSASLAASRGASSGFFAFVAAFFDAIQAADRRVGHGEPFGL